jgi:hypothetical protein
MWVRKTTDEIKAIDRRAKFNPIFAVGGGAVTSFVALLDENGLLWKTALWRSETVMMDIVWTGLLAFLFGFVLFYAFQIIVMVLLPVRSPMAVLFDASYVICERCRSINARTPGNVCSSCGGAETPLEHWRWIDEPVDPNAHSERSA